jgi:DNA-binding protein YbaB
MSRALNDFIEARDRGMVEDVVVEAIVEAVADLFQTLAELLSTPSMEL